jgi:hypothetical protein
MMPVKEPMTRRIRIMMTPIRTYVIHLGCESPLSGFVVSLMLAFLLFQDRRSPLGVYHGLIGNFVRIFILKVYHNAFDLMAVKNCARIRSVLAGFSKIPRTGLVESGLPENHRYNERIEK